MISNQVAVIGIVFQPKTEKFVILKRRDVPVWVLPGGGVDPGESTEKAVLREILEETGVTARILRQSGLYTPLNKLAKETHVFICEAVSGSLTTGSETQALYYVSASELPENFFIVHGDWLNDAFEHTDSLVKKPITRVTYWNLFLYFLKKPLQVIRYAFSRLGFPINQ